MPAVSKQQQKFFGVVKAMQAGDIPKKGEAGKVAKDMSKKDVDDYASTKHKGLPKKVKQETMTAKRLKEIVFEELDKILREETITVKEFASIVKEEVNRFKSSGYSQVDTGPKRWYKSLDDKYTEYEKATNKALKEESAKDKFGAPPINKWWTGDKDALMSAIYHVKRQLPPTDKAKYEKNWKSIVKQLQKMYPAPNEIYIQRLNELKIGNKINKARAKAHFKQGENIAVVDKNTGDAIRITDLRQLDTFDSKTHDFAYITESVNEALPKFKTPFEAYSWIMNKRGEAMDIETEMLNTSAEIQDKYKDMEQEAEPGGGPIQARYAKEIEALELQHKNLRTQFAAVMAEIDEYDQNY